MPRPLLTALLFVLATAGAGLAQQPTEDTQTTEDTQNNEATQVDDRLRIGVRRDARPFSYRSDVNVDVLTAATPGPLAKQKYTGFMIKICDAVLTDMLINPVLPFTEQDIEIVDVDNLIEKNPEISRFDYFGTYPDAGSGVLTGDEFDILCDPATITNERRAGLILSPPLFLSGISFIDLRSSSPPKQDGCPDKPLIGLVGNTTAANSGIRAILDADELPQYRSLLIEWMNNGKNECKDGKDYEAVKILFSHSIAAEEFCDKKDQKFHYYLGDQEIIAHNARQFPGCDFENAGRTFTTDRYAIFGKLNYANPTRALRVARFFEVLSQKVPFSPSILDMAFSDTFIGTEKSRALELFYWSIRGPK